MITHIDNRAVSILPTTVQKVIVEIRRAVPRPGYCPLAVHMKKTGGSPSARTYLRWLSAERYDQAMMLLQDTHAPAYLTRGYCPLGMHPLAIASEPCEMDHFLFRRPPFDAEELLDFIRWWESLDEDDAELGMFLVWDCPLDEDVVDNKPSLSTFE